MLTENRNCAASNFGVRRKNVANYRGMNDDEIDEFELQRAVQAKEQEVINIHYQFTASSDGIIDFFF